MNYFKELVIICQLFDLFVLKSSWICSWLFDFFTPWLIWLICTLFVIYLNDYMTLDYLWLFANDYLWLFEFVDYLWLFVSLIICTYLKFQLFEAYLWLLYSDLFVIIWENNYFNYFHYLLNGYLKLFEMLVNYLLSWLFVIIWSDCQLFGGFTRSQN